MWGKEVYRDRIGTMTYHVEFSKPTWEQEISVHVTADSMGKRKQG